LDYESVKYVEGFIDNIIYRNEDNGYTVFEIIYQGAVKGIGSKMAERIVDTFGDDTFRIMEDEPERLAEIKGISIAKAIDIANQLADKHDMRRAMMFLQNYGIQMNLANKIFKRYGNDIYTIIEQNPYRLADDIEGVGFKTADEIASRVGIKVDSEFRIRSGMFYCLNQAALQGHVYLPYEELKRQVSSLLLIDISSTIITSASNGLSSFLSKLIPRLDDIQKEAVVKAALNGLVIITGGPGTGKTTTINTIIKYFEMEGLEIRLAAPTGRAAKRMTETCGFEAQTIHRLLEIVGSTMADKEDKKNQTSSLGMSFDRNEDNPLEADVIIVDEMSISRSDDTCLFNSS
jgi:exodeoxyribonuclease V alpha subunit